MRKHVLIFIHGMGVYVDNEGKSKGDWTTAVAEVLKDQYDKYPRLTTPFAELFEVVHVEYDTVFHQILKRWEDEAQKIKNHGIQSAEIATRMVDWLDGGAELDDNFAWTHVGDVVLYHFFNLVRQRVKAHVAKQIHTALQPRAGVGAVVDWSIIAHSQGTAVCHDVLHAMSAFTPNEVGVPVLSTLAPRPRVVAMLANVSKILQGDAKVYESKVAPGRACDVYLSANNRFDPFVMEKLLVPERFAPQGRDNWDAALSDGTFIDVETENVHELNVHSAANYLVNPAVHIPLLRAMCGFGAISPSTEAEAMEDFDDIGAAAAKNLLDGLLEDHKEEGWFEALAKLLPLLEDV